MPVGIWRVNRDLPEGEALRGRLVIFCPPDMDIIRMAKEKGILRAGTCEGVYKPLLKEIVGLPGDVIEYADGFSINGHRLPNSMIRRFDVGGIQLPNSKRFIVPEGQLWLMSSYSGLSFDSRYFGFVSRKKIVGLAEPLLVSI